LSIKTRSEADERELEVLLEAARRATWDALHGPTHLRSGRYLPRDAVAEVGARTTEGGRVAAQQAAAADERRARTERRR
jgi:hypothetical protein